jgi:hypothetical protein
LRLGRDDVYLLAAWADFLLDAGRPQEVLGALAAWEAADSLLLRLAEAGTLLQRPEAARWAQAAHKASDSYLILDVNGREVSGQWDIALRDIDFALGLDADGNGEITWGELRARQPTSMPGRSAASACSAAAPAGYGSPTTWWTRTPTAPTPCCNWRRVPARRPS